MLWILKNQLGRRNLSDFQFKLLVGQEYELEHRIEGRPKKEEPIAEKLGQSDQVKSPGETRDRLAQEHNISPKTVQRSHELYKTFQAVKEVAPEVARKLESEEIKTSDKAINAVGKVLRKGTPEQKEQVISEVKFDFKKAAVGRYGSL